MRDLSLHILDILQNSVRAGAEKISVILTVLPESDLLEILIEDNGCGMDQELLKRVTDPFETTRTTRKVGLGIPLYKASAEQTGGTFAIRSEPGIGTEVAAGFKLGSIDRLPLGDLSGVIADMAAGNPGIDIRLELSCESRESEFSSAETAQVLGEVPLTEYSVMVWMKEYIGEQINDILGGVLNEIDR